MQTQLDSPPTVPHASAAHLDGRRRRWPWVAFAVILILLGAAASFVVNYDPLCSGPCTGVGGVHGGTVTSLGSFTSPQGDSFTAARVSHAPGEEFSYWFTLSTQGPVGVTIASIGGEDPTFSTYAIDRVQMKPLVGDARTSAFHPFFLAPKQYVDILVTARMRGCMEEGNATGIGSIPVGYRVFGISRSTIVYLPESIELTGKAGVVCR